MTITLPKRARYRWHGLVWVAWLVWAAWLVRVGMGYNNGVKWYQTSPLYSVVERMKQVQPPDSDATISKGRFIM
jgi:hypothetical protein